MPTWLIVGAGYAGCVLAERIASQRNERVVLIDRRNHIGGNAYDYINGSGILVHKYGPHIFHTNSQSVVEYLSKFTKWRHYEHRVLANVGGNYYPIPINRNTINAVFNKNLSTEEEVRIFLASKTETILKIRTSEDVVVSQVGRELYEIFYHNYTRKQWGVDPSQLDRSVTARIPVRFNTDDRYFGDAFQAMPQAGFTAMFKKMIDNPNIEVNLNVDFRSYMHPSTIDKIIYTGPIDEFFNYRFGKLPYRSLRFDHATLDVEWHQPVAVINYPQTELFTRSTEFKHITGQYHRKTSIVKEYPEDNGEPYYPIPNSINHKILKAYEEMAFNLPNVWFCGRLANYKYYNMDQVVAQALSKYRKINQKMIQS